MFRNNVSEFTLTGIGSTRGPRPSFQPAVEALEERVVLTIQTPSLGSILNGANNLANQANALYTQVIDKQGTISQAEKDRYGQQVKDLESWKVRLEGLLWRRLRDPATRAKVAELRQTNPRRFSQIQKALSIIRSDFQKVNDIKFGIGDELSHAASPPARPSAPAPNQGLAGRWSWGSIPVTLQESNASITGSWDDPDGTGRISGGSFNPQTRILHLDWDEQWHDQHGTADLTLSPDGRTLSGPWYTSSGAQGGTWTLTR